ncbi:MAG: YitT family protein [Oscillospiraceae bacterium]
MKITKEKALTLGANILKILVGALIFAAGIRWFYFPSSLVSGGVTGIAMIINFLTDAPVGIVVIAINIPLFLIALRTYGPRFLIGSLFGMLSSSIAIDLLSMIELEITTEPLLAAIYGGVFAGLGLGIVFTTGATTGGTDVVARLIREKFPYINLGTFMLALDGVVVTAYALIFKNYDNAMYSVLSLFITAKLIDMVLYGSSQDKLCHIISEYSDEIKAAIVEKLDRGVTLLSGKGAYSGQEKQILLCVVKRRQIVEIKKIIKNIDKTAFVIVTDTRDVFGQGFGDITIDK